MHALRQPPDAPELPLQIRAPQITLIELPQILHVADHTLLARLLVVSVDVATHQRSYPAGFCQCEP
jgi:hypothetical protein